jgi:hypothetical protein
MIVEVRGTTAEDVEAARRELVALTREWGHEAEVADEAPRVEADRPDDRGVDPVAVAALVVSIPSAALAVHDLVDRMRNRRRAKELVDRAERLRTQHVTLWVVRPGEPPAELADLAPDRVLELMDGEEPAAGITPDGPRGPGMPAAGGG